MAKSVGVNGLGRHYRYGGLPGFLGFPTLGTARCDIRTRRLTSFDPLISDVLAYLLLSASAKFPLVWASLTRSGHLEDLRRALDSLASAYLLYLH